MREELKKLIKEYKTFCDEQTAKIEKDAKDPRAGMSFTFDGFYLWLNDELIESGKLPAPKEEK